MHHAPQLHDTIHLDAKGIATVLGALEARVLQGLWDIGHPATARDVHTRIVQDHSVQLLTVITVLNRLVRKHIAWRMKRQGRWHFAAELSESAFLAYAAHYVAEGVITLNPAIVSSFVDVLAERDPAQLRILALHLRHRMREQETSTVRRRAISQHGEQR